MRAARGFASMSVIFNAQRKRVPFAKGISCGQLCSEALWCHICTVFHCHPRPRAHVCWTSWLEPLRSRADPASHSTDPNTRGCGTTYFVVCVHPILLRWRDGRPAPVHHNKGYTLWDHRVTEAISNLLEVFRAPAISPHCAEPLFVKTSRSAQSLLALVKMGKASPPGADTEQSLQPALKSPGRGSSCSACCSRLLTRALFPVACVQLDSICQCATNRAWGWSLTCIAQVCDGAWTCVLGAGRCKGTWRSTDVLDFAGCLGTHTHVPSAQAAAGWTSQNYNKGTAKKTPLWSKKTLYIDLRPKLLI